MYTYPRSDLDRPRKLLSLVGSFWATTYQGMDLVQSTLDARARLDAQAHLDLLELIASISRFTVPIFHRENWHYLTFWESELNNFEALVTPYANEAAETYRTNTNLQFGVPPEATTYSVPCPVDLAQGKILLNRLTEPSLTWIEGIDFWRPRPGVLTFRENPFANELVPIQELFRDGQAVDRQGGLWIFHGDWDWNHVYEQFAYAFKLRLQSSEGYRDLTNAVFDALLHGTTSVDLHQAWSAITGVSLVRGNEETVETIAEDARSLCVITDQHAYKFPKGSRAVVTAGQKIQAGEPLVDTLQFFEFGRGQVPLELPALVLGPGVLSTGYLGDLTFENKEVPLFIDTDEDGWTRVEFEVGGFPGDVDKFWDDVHAKGRQQGKTLAMYLDRRPNPVGQPPAASLPATINPLAFLCRNIFRYHAFVVKVRASHLGHRALGLWTAEQLRRIVPPETLMLVVVELEHSDEPIIMEGSGDESRPGYEERVSGFPCMVVSEVVDGTAMIQERVRAYQIKGKCE